MIKEKRILDTFSGCGRLYELHRKYNPQEIYMVDLHPESV